MHYYLAQKIWKFETITFIMKHPVYQTASSARQILPATSSKKYSHSAAVERHVADSSGGGAANELRGRVQQFNERVHRANTH